MSRVQEIGEKFAVVTGVVVEGTLSDATEEVADERGTFFGNDSGGDFCSGVEQGRGIERETALGVRGAVDDAADLRPVEGCGTHRTRLYCNI